MMNMMLVGECESSDSENKECDTRCNGKSEFSYRNGNVYYLSIADDIYGRQFYHQPEYNIYGQESYDNTNSDADADSDHRLMQVI